MARALIKKRPGMANHRSPSNIGVNFTQPVADETLKRICQPAKLEALPYEQAHDHVEQTIKEMRKVVQIKKPDAETKDAA